MIKSLSIPQTNLPFQQRLLYICKKPTTLTINNKPQIDFLLLDKEIQQLQQLQEKTCQQIVQFVDQHLQQFMTINQKFCNVQDNVYNTENLIKSLIPKINHHKTKVYGEQSKIRKVVQQWEKDKIQNRLIQVNKQNTQFILQFVQCFEQFISLNVEQLTKYHKYNIVHFLNKKNNFKVFIEHPYLNKNISQSSVINLIDNISEQLEFYLSEQLARLCSQKSQTINTKNNLENAHIQNNNQDSLENNAQNNQQNNRKTSASGQIGILEQLKLWYSFMGKEESYYEIVEDAIAGREFGALQGYLINGKQQLLLGRGTDNLKQFFTGLARVLKGFPQEYPIQRLLAITYKFLTKKQLSFLYSYVSPIFPLSYSAYINCLQILPNKLKSELMQHHSWNLKFWSQLRIKSIMDRSNKQIQNLSKWIDIVLKKGFMIGGVKGQMIKLVFMLVNRFCLKVGEGQGEESAVEGKGIVSIFAQRQMIMSGIQLKLREGFEEELLGEQMQRGIVQEELKKIVENVKNQLTKCLTSWIIKNMDMIITTCKSSLVPCKSLVLQTISKKSSKSLVNTQQSILRPFSAFTKNNPEIPIPCLEFIQQIILKEVEKFYDSQYAKQIYNHCESHVSTQQMKAVMEVVAYQRQTLFEKSS